MRKLKLRLNNLSELELVIEIYLSLELLLLGLSGGVSSGAEIAVLPHDGGD